MEEFIFAPSHQLSGCACLCFHWSPRMFSDESCPLVSTRVVIWIRQTIVCPRCSGQLEPNAGCQPSPCVSIDLWPLVCLIFTTLFQEWYMWQHMFWLWIQLQKQSKLVDQLDHWFPVFTCYTFTMQQNPLDFTMPLKSLEIIVESVWK